MQRLNHPHRRLAISLAALAGFVDGVGFMSAGGYFVSFMSGNTTRLAVNIATDWGAALVPLLLIAGFTGGVFLGAVVALQSGQWQARNVTALSAGLLIAGAAAEYSGSRMLGLTSMVIAMGALNNCFQREGASSFGLTYMTGALVRFGQGLAYRLCGRQAPGFLALLLLWAALGGGAIFGAFAQQHLGTHSLALAGLFATLAVAAAVVAGPDERDQV